MNDPTRATTHTLSHDPAHVQLLEDTLARFRTVLGSAHFVLDPLPDASPYSSIATALAVEGAAIWHAWRSEGRRAEETTLPTLPSAATIVDWSIRRFRLHDRGALAKLRTASNDLADAVDCLVYQYLCAAAWAQRHRIFPGERWRHWPNEIADVAHEIFLAKRRTICTRYDPARPLRSYVASYAQTGSLRTNAKLGLGIGAPSVVVDMHAVDPPDVEMTECASTRSQYRTESDPRALPRVLPDHIRLYLQNVPDAEIAQRLGIKTDSVRTARRRWANRVRRSLGGTSHESHRGSSTGRDAVYPDEGIDDER